MEEQRQIADTVSFIMKHKVTHIGLQFPDHLLMQSVIIQQLLESALSAISKDIKHLLFIMAYTRFATCCVDEIPAQHYMQRWSFIMNGHVVPQPTESWYFIFW